MPGDDDLADGPSRSRRARAIVAALGVTQIVGYGCLWYSFPVVLSPVAKDLGASRTAVTGAFTVAVLGTAALAVPVGRWLDRHGARGLMTLGSVIGTALLVMLSRVHSLTALYAVWAGIGAVGATVLYDAAFATAIAWSAPARRATSVLTITVVAGFSSTVFLPLTGHLVGAYGWRTALLVLAAVHAALTVPLHAFVLRAPPHVQVERADPTLRAQAHADRRALLARAARDVRFWLLGLAFTAEAVAFSTVTVHLVDVLTAAGHPASVAATVSGALGVLSVTGRVVVSGLSRRYSQTLVVATVFAGQAVAAALLPAVASSTVGAVAAVACFGFGFGVATIARPALVVALFGTTAYASLSGRLAVPITLTIAAAPLAMAALQRSAASWTPVLLAVGVCDLLAAAGILLAGRSPRRSHGDHPAGYPADGALPIV